MKEKIIHFVVSIIGYGALMAVVLLLFGWESGGGWFFIIFYGICMGFAEIFIFEPMRKRARRKKAGKQG